MGAPGPGERRGCSPRCSAQGLVSSPQLHPLLPPLRAELPSARTAWSCRSRGGPGRARLRTPEPPSPGCSQQEPRYVCAASGVAANIPRLVITSVAAALEPRTA